MHYRKLGKTNFNVSEVSLGAWQIGGAWGDVSDTDAERVMHAAIEQGINFIDTADVYGDGRSERFIAKALSETKTQVFVATKAGRRLQPHTADGYNRENLTAFVERSLKNLKSLAIPHLPRTIIGISIETAINSIAGKRSRASTSKMRLMPSIIFGEWSPKG
jgi:aryl-alcohol dehydrogenase-like predicted oxidoreductase